MINLDEGLDFGNPNLGNAHPHLLTHEVIDRRTGVARILAADLPRGNAAHVATVAQVGVVGFPACDGDDRAIIYTQVDLSVPTTVSLFRQPLAEDGITPAGQPALWPEDADYAAIDRRGTFVASNAVPEVRLTSPAPGQRFSLPAQVPLTASATDPDGTLARVEFYAGSPVVGTDSSAPYSASQTVNTSPSGLLRLTARAIDNLGGQADSTPIEIRFDQAPASGVRWGSGFDVFARPEAGEVLVAMGSRGPVTLGARCKRAVNGRPVLRAEHTGFHGIQQCLHLCQLPPQLRPVRVFQIKPRIAVGKIGLGQFETHRPCERLQFRCPLYQAVMELDEIMGLLQRPAEANQLRLENLLHHLR